jgi:photosystem II stability/assembly factor-like uncharacterized protein
MNGFGMELAQQLQDGCEGVLCEMNAPERRLTAKPYFSSANISSSKRRNKTMKRNFMRVSLLVFGIAFIRAPASFAQGGWVSQNVAFTGDLFAVATLDAQTSVAVDGLGNVLRTTDGGATWVVQSSGSQVPLYSLSFVNPMVGTAVGELGTILRTTDGGVTWIPVDSGTTYFLTGVSFADAANGIAVGDFGTILRTSDGGASWNPQDSGTPQPLYAVSFVNADTATVVGNTGIILRTVDGGATWLLQDSGSYDYLSGVSFVDANTGWAIGGALIGNGTVVHTNDGGATWIEQGHTWPDLWGVSFADANNGMAVGYGGTILRTTDGGATWAFLNSSTMNTLTGVSFADASTWTTVGYSGLILGTTDGGAHWTRQFHGAPDLNGVSLVDANIGTVVGEYGTILRTSDGGNTWILQPSGTTQSLSGVSFVDANTGTVVGLNGAILRTSDGGNTWVAQSSGLQDLILRGVSFSNADHGFAWGELSSLPTFLRTTDGGATWTNSPIDPRQNPYGVKGVAFVDPNNGYAIGNGGFGSWCAHDMCASLWETTDGGITWTYQLVAWSRTLFYGISAAAGTVTVAGYHPGAGGIFILQNKDGETWVDHRYPLDTPTLTGVYFVDQNTGWFFGYSYPGLGNVILRTIDGGDTLVLQASTISSRLKGMSFVDSSMGIVVGENGTILHTTTGGEEIASWKIPRIDPALSHSSPVQ